AGVRFAALPAATGLGSGTCRGCVCRDSWGWGRCSCRADGEIHRGLRGSFAAAFDRGARVRVVRIEGLPFARGRKVALAVDALGASARTCSSVQGIATRARMPPGLSKWKNELGDRELRFAICDWEL